MEGIVMHEAFESSFSLSPLSPDERRKADRRSILAGLKITVRIADGSKTKMLKVSPHDISPFGVGFWHNKEITEGTAIEFLPSEDSVEAVSGIAVRCNVVGESLFEVGVRFHDEISVKRFMRWFVTPRSSVA